MTEAVIIPTGEEIAEGIVTDTDGPMIQGVLEELDPQCMVQRIPPVMDDETIISQTIKHCAGGDTRFIVLIGGSGGGHRHSATLAKDFTHTAMEHLLEQKQSTSLYGKNGHLWCRLVCGYVNSTLVINVPGPYREAKAAIEAFALLWKAGPHDLARINRAMAEAVKRQYA